MKFNNPSLINYVRVAKGGLVPIGCLEKEDMRKWLEKFKQAMWDHWAKKTKEVENGKCEN